MTLQRLRKNSVTKLSLSGFLMIAAGNMNLDVQSVGGSILVVPNFTLAADTSRGNRPGFSTAMSPDKAEPLFELFYREIKGRISQH